MTKIRRAIKGAKALKTKTTTTATAKPDFYDRQIRRLMRLPGEDFGDEVNREWLVGKGLFAPCSKNRSFGLRIGCLTMVKSGRWFASTSKLTAAIRVDSRIPARVEDITKPSLPVFAEWQRRLDKELGRKPL